ncbi:MAG: SGNH/GDSL hydrolase family protein [Limnochordales bacterium]|nr:SGNH/GDSL hydrolase family protein [Limnochordales bacterium]
MQPQPALFPEFPVGAGQKFLCLGDSITEARPGYVSLLDAAFQALFPERQIRVINAGISGNKVTDLLARLDRDVIAARPDWMTIMIGVNDVWHDFLSADHHGLPLNEYVSVYRQLLRKLQAELPATRVILLTPTFIGEEPHTPENQRLAGYVRAVKELGEEFSLPVIDMNARFWAALQAGRTADASFHLTTDGVHPTLAGHMLLAITILQALGVTVKEPGD